MKYNFKNLRHTFWVASNRKQCRLLQSETIALGRHIDLEQQKSQPKLTNTKKVKDIWSVSKSIQMEVDFQTCHILYYTGPNFASALPPLQENNKGHKTNNH